MEIAEIGLTCSTASKNENIRELAADKLFALQNTDAARRPGQLLSGQRAGAIRSRTATCSRQPDAAWLIDTGFGGDEAALRAQIESLIPRTLPLSLLPLRLNEFMSIQNIDPFTLYFNVKECFTGNPDAAFWFDFGAGSDSGQNTLDSSTSPPSAARRRSRSANMGRPVVVYQAPIRLIATRWIYDEATKTMFTSDMFTHTWRDRAGRPVDHPGRRRRPDRLRPRALVPAQHPLLVAGGRRHREAPRRHRQDPDKHDIETIAPGYGCILRGKKTVEKHIKLVDDVLSSLDKSVATSRYVGRDEER